MLITGDISTVDGMPNWIESVSENLVDVHKPLWELDRHAILDTLISNDFKVVCSLAYKKYFQSTIAGRYLDSTLISELKQLPIDPCGEQGEYHTWVLDAPFFKESLCSWGVHASLMRTNIVISLMNRQRKRGKGLTL